MIYRVVCDDGGLRSEEVYGDAAGYYLSLPEAYRALAAMRNDWRALLAQDDTRAYGILESLCVQSFFHPDDVLPVETFNAEKEATQ